MTYFGKALRVAQASNWLGANQFELQRKQADGSWLTFAICETKKQATISMVALF